MAGRKNEQVVVDCNVFVGGQGKLGVAINMKPPNIEFTTLESEASSAGKVNYVYGAIENLEAEFTIAEHDRSIYKELVKLNDAEFIFKESVSQGALGDNKLVEWVLRGHITHIEESEIKRGEKKALVVKMGSCWYYKKTINNSVVFEVDKKNGICKPDGKTDILEQSRNQVKG